jgi:hypothetical protein
LTKEGKGRQNNKNKYPPNKSTRKQTKAKVDAVETKKGRKIENTTEPAMKK